MIIAISGKIGSGKNTVANLVAKYLTNTSKTIVHKYFAFKLKKIVEIITGIEMKQSFWNNYFSNGITDFSSEAKNIFIAEFNMTIGQMLQKIGTDVFRDHFDREIWIKALFADYDQFEHSNSIWIITDVRFLNEVQKIKELDGILIKVNRFEKNIDEFSKRDKQHASEIELDDCQDFDFVIDNNSTLEDLEENVKQIITNIIINV